MNRIAPRSLALALLPVAAFLCAVSCEAPLAPGYRIVGESREVQFVAGGTPRLHVRGQFELQNIGNRDLAFLDANFPNGKVFGRQNLHVEMDGREIAPSSLPDEYQQEQPDALRIPFDPPWTRGEKAQLTIEYDLASPEDSGSRITLAANEFHLGSRGWFPVLQPPKHVFSPYPKRPAATAFTVLLPSDFLLLARGAPKGRKKDGGETEYRFLIVANDLPPFVVAGRYLESPPKSGAKATAFWTLEPLKDDPGYAVAQITQAWNTLDTDFGPLDRNIAAPHVVESPELREHLPGEPGPAAAPFPGGALVNPQALALGIGSDRFLEMVTHSLAHNWFGDQMYPAADAAIGMGEGLPEYATIVVDEARNGAGARRDRILKYIEEYDEAKKNADERPLRLVRLSDSLPVRRIALAKAPLFFIAIEDECGETPVRNSLRQMVALLRGQEASYDSLRSALEESTGKNLGELFRIWLNEKGIPAAFRDRYQ